MNNSPSVNSEEMKDIIQDIMTWKRIPYVSSLNFLDYIRSWNDNFLPEEDSLSDAEKLMVSRIFLDLVREAVVGFKNDPKEGCIIWIPSSECL